MTITLFVLLCLAQAADVYTTLRGVKAGAVEANPVLVKLLGKRPGLALLAIKLAVVAWVGYAIDGMGWQADNAYLSAMIVLTLVLGYAAHSNWRIIRQLEQ